MYLVSYDISSDRLRTKVAKTLEGYGVRVQYSVFECDLSDRKFGKLYSELLRLTADMSEGSIRFYSICGHCEEKIMTIGQVTPGREQIDEELIFV